MRLRAGLILFISFSTILIVGGCRKPLAPTYDRNQAPETWITAAPLDTITYRDGTRPVQTDPGYLPFRYHLYWAGSDPDGKVAGFYFAVVETLPLPVPPDPLPPPLPGPKARDYKFTTKTDSVFVFSVSDQRTDRQHAFYLYAVDNLGKPDPTPARFIFNAIDRFPPLPVIDKFTGTGIIWAQDPTTLALTRVIHADTVTAADSFVRGVPPARTLPTVSRLDVAWHSEITTTENEAVGYKYKLDEPSFVSVGASITTLSYNTGPSDVVGPGVKIFRLRAVDRAGGAREVTRTFQMNIPPTTWFAGSDPNAPIWQRGPAGERFITVTNWTSGIPNLAGVSLLSSDSVKTMPSQRIPRKNFLELYGNRIYLRQERDTVDMNSWVVFFCGGFDPDSPYLVNYRSNDPLAPDSTNNPVLQLRPSNGSPIGFRSRIPVFLSPTGPLSAPSQTGLFPIFDPASVYRAPAIASYWSMSQSGTAYLYARAEDGNNQADLRIGSTPALQPKDIVYAVDSTATPTADQVALRPLILTFFVNRAPTFTLTDPTFSPRPNNAPNYTRVLNIKLVAVDADPYDPGTPTVVGGPSSGRVFRYAVKFRSPRNGSVVPNDSVTWTPPTLDRTGTPPTTVSLPDSLGGTRVRVMWELCDCSQCENTPGQGRCNFYSYFINVTAPPAPATAAAAERSDEASGPGQAVLAEKKRGGR